MAAELGIGVTTFNRRERLLSTLDRVRRHTRTPHRLIVADDGSADGTLQALRQRRIPHVSGPNRGVAWNKNRALYYLHAVQRCDTVILLEDDTFPVADGWERDWIEAASRWGHMNFAGEWVAPYFVSGVGTVADPIVSTQIPGVCASFSREALDLVGYMDTRFRRYGFEHGEHSLRLLRLGLGGSLSPRGHYLLASPLRAEDLHDNLHLGALPENREIFARLLDDETTHRRAWRNPTERRLLFGELLSARTYSAESAARIRVHLAGTRLRSLLRGSRKRLSGEEPSIPR